MAQILANGLVQFNDGRILYSDTPLTGQDFMELQVLLPQINPVLGRAAMVGFPFVSGGGGGGSPGARGADGTPGATGVGTSGGTGPQGATGIGGMTGPPGATGPSGGPPGATGAQGTTGAQGQTGVQGNTGNGPVGATGAQGVTGPGAGAQGVTGVQGTTGPTGGQQGQTGVQGTTGIQGATGAGSQGQTGTQGATGPAGTSTQNAIIESQVIGQNADFLSVAGLNATLIANAGNPFVYDINGQQTTLTSNVVLAVTNNANSFIWIDDTGALGASAFPCIYSLVAPGAPATDQHWFDIGHNHMMRWNGAAFLPVNRIFIGYVRADAGAINTRYICEPLNLTPNERFLTRGAGTDGFFEVSSGTTTIDGQKNYTAIVIRGTAVVNHTAAVLTQLDLGVQGTVAVIGTAGVDLNGLGAPAGVQGVTGVDGGLGGAGGGGSPPGANNANGGNHLVPWGVPLIRGAGVRSVTDNVPGGTGEASQIPAEGLLSPTIFSLYGGGGGGAGHTGGTAGVSSAGGGGIQIRAAAIGIGTGAFMRSNSANGTNGINNNTGGGSSGGGGVIALFAQAFWNDGTFSASVGSGGGEGGSGSGGPGGIGGVGAAFWRRW